MLRNFLFRTSQFIHLSEQNLLFRTFLTQIWKYSTINRALVLKFSFFS